MATVFMPVTVIDDLCASCPTLDISTEHSVLYSNDIVAYTNNMICSHYEECRKREEYRRKCKHNVQEESE